MSSILAFLKAIYEHKEKIILGALIIAFAGVAYVQVKKNQGLEPNGDNPDEIISGDLKPPREPTVFKAPGLGNPYPLQKYPKLVGDIFSPPAVERRGPEERELKWAQIRVKSVFDPTQSGSYIAIVEVDNRSRIVKEGQLFDNYEVRRIDGVRSCVIIFRRDTDEEREFCKQE